MGMFDRLMKTEQRSLENPNVPVSADNFLHLMGWGDFNSSSGVVVNVESALGVPAIWAAVNFISGTLASLPLEVMRRTQGGTERKGAVGYMGRPRFFNHDSGASYSARGDRQNGGRDS